MHAAAHDDPEALAYVRAELERGLRKLDESPALYMLSLLWSALALRDAEAAAGLLARLEPLARAPVNLDNLYPLGRTLGDAAVLLGERERALSLYQQALEGATHLGFRPEIAVLRLHLAELLLEHYSAERAVALDHLEFALKEFEA